MKRTIFSIFTALMLLSWSSMAFADTSTDMIETENNPALEVTTENQDQSGLIIGTESSETGINLDANTDEATTINAQIDTGNNTVDSSTMVDSYGTGDIEGQIVTEKISNSSLNPDSEIDTKTAASDDEVNMDDFDNMDSHFKIGGSGNTNEGFFVLDSNDQMNLDLNTGKNDFEHNTVINKFQTGNINFVSNEVNLANLNNPELLLNLKLYTITGNLNGNIMLDEEMLNQAPDIHIMDTDGTVTGSTQSNIDHSSNYDMETGANTFEENSLVGDISTGDASAGYFSKDIAGTFTKMNFFIVNVLGEWSGINELFGVDNVIVNTMDPAQNLANNQTTDDTSSTINQSQTVNITANTGQNTFRRNTLVGSAKTGNINLMENVINLKDNLSSLSNKFNIFVVNIVGNWFGNLSKKSTSNTGGDDTGGGGNDGTGGDGGGGSGGGNNPPITENSASSTEDQYLVLGVQETTTTTINKVQRLALAANQITVDPSNISAGPDMKPLAYLLLLLPLSIVTSLCKYTKKSLDK